MIQNLKKAVKDLQLIELLPGEDAQKNLVWQWAVLVSRVITKYLPAFTCLQSEVVKSDIVSLSLQILFAPKPKSSIIHWYQNS